MCLNETCHVEVTNEVSNNERGNIETSPTLAGKQTNKPARKTSEEKYIKGKEDGKSFSKESDVDSGCGSSCHEIYATEPSTTHAQLNVSSLVYCHTQKMETIEKDKFMDNVSGRMHECKEHEISKAPLTGKVLQETNTELELCDSLVERGSSNEQWSEFQKSEVVTDSFEELIKLAKDGMSTLGRKRVDNVGKNKISACLQTTTPVDNPCRTQGTSTNADEAMESKDENLHSKTESQLCLDARKVDSGVKCASSTSLCLDDTNMGTSHRSDKQNQSDTFIAKTSHSTTTTAKHMEKSTEKTSHCATSGNQSGIPLVEILHTTANNQLDKYTNPSGTCVVEIPTISLEPELHTVAENHELPCTKEDSVYHDTQLVNNDQSIQEQSQQETNEASSNGEELHSKQNHIPLRIQESLLTNGQLIIEKTDRPKSLMLPSTNKDSEIDKVKYGLKVPSLETLSLPSHVQATDQGGRIRSFSATIRRKLSFRERTSTDDPDVDGQVEPKNKKLKGFRSFRMNRKKKPKALKSEEISQSTGCLPDSKNYLSTIDKLIFHENTESAIFSDVPFTIPEISEQ